MGISGFSKRLAFDFTGREVWATFLRSVPKGNGLGLLASFSFPKTSKSADPLVGSSGREAFYLLSFQVL